MSNIAGTIPMIQDVDPSGSLTINVPLQLPNCRFMPTMALAYHSAATRVSVFGRGWALMGAPIIERVPATKAQDGFRGVVGYIEKDRFALDGQRLIQIAEKNNNKTEYRFEIEQWTKFFAIGEDIANPTSWEQWLPDGTVRKFGTTPDSNIKGVGLTYTRVWAISKASDPFTNYITFKWINEDELQGAFYLSEVSYGGNTSVHPDLDHQRKVSFNYELRTDIITEYLGGHKIRTERRLKEIHCSVKEEFKWSYEIGYDYAPLTLVSRIISIAFGNAAKTTKVEPLKFTWSNADAKVFDEIKDVATLPLKGTDILITPMDVDASGFSDMVVASTSKNPGNGDKDELYLNIFMSDTEGKLKDTPTPGSGFSGLLPPKQLLPFDANGDGQTDLLHILPSTDGYSLTILLSDRNKFTKQTPLQFKPSKMGGSFRLGDFKGDGKIGLVYIYLEGIAEGGEKQLKFVQFTTDGKQLTAGAVQGGPTPQEGVKLENFKVVVGDLNGDGSDDLFVFAPLSDANWMIYFIQSIDGKLQYKATDPLKDAGKAIAYTVDSTILPFKADSDGKTSLVIASKKGENLQFQTLRSLGNSFLADKKPTATQVKYEGNIVVARVISQNTPDLVNFVQGASGPALHVFRFSGDTFEEVPSVTQPTSGLKGSLARWADLRGVGRTDCLFNTIGSDNKMTVHSLQCAGSQPLDRILTSTNGLGAVTTVLYGALTDPSIYSYASTAYKQPTALMNSSANNAISVSPLVSGTTGLQSTEVTRSDVIYFPTFVVRSICTNPGPKSNIFETFKYSYFNAKIDFDGRGWLGFQTITKKGDKKGISEVTTYTQTFPLIGQVSSMERKDGNTSLERMVYSWGSKQINNNKNYRLFLQKVKETYFEEEPATWDVSVQFTYDNYDNIILTSISSSQSSSGTLTIASTYQDPDVSGPWVVGNKKTEDIKQDSSALKRTKWDYVFGSSLCKETQEWISNGKWAKTKLDFDKAGNKASLTGPFVYDENSTFRQEFTYDSTYSVITLTKTHTSLGKYLVEHTSSDLATSLLLEVEKPNGLITAFTYDILGRKTQVLQGTDRTKFDVMEKTNFAMQNAMLVETREINNGLAGTDNAMRKVVTHYDGLLRPLSVQKSRPDVLASFVRVDTKYDELGRVSSRSKEYLSGSTPQLFEYFYDKRSRLIQETYPPNKNGGQSITHKLAYSCKSGAPLVTETLSAGVTTNNQTSVREFSLVPNADTPSTGHFVKLCVSKRTSEVGQSVYTTFDILGRPKKIVDTAGVQLALDYDGLSRQTERKLSTGGGTPVTFSHFKLDYEASGKQDRVDLQNVRTGTKVITRSDFCQRTVLKTTPEGTLVFTYDADKLSRGQLSKVVSAPNGIVHAYQYDSRGNRSSSILSLNLDDRTLSLVTKYAWTAAGQLLKVTNPDGSFISKTYFPDGLTIKRSELTLKDGTVGKASVAFSDLDNAFTVPKTRTFGNGLISKISMIDSGVPSGDALWNAGQTEKVLDQNWNYDAFNKISSHKIGGSTSTYKYDDAGQLLKYDTTNFTYDNSGNIKTKGDYTFTNSGWQLNSIQDLSENSISYKYTSDGNVKTKTVKTKAAGEKKTSMTYDTEGRLAKLDDTTFLYDYAGRLLKTTAGNGNAVIYASPTCEIKVSPKPAKHLITIYLTDSQRRASYTAEWTPESGTATNGAIYYFHQDQLGSTVAVSDSQGAIVTQYSYDALGNMSISTGQDVARYKYCGKELFGTIYYFGSRFYDPQTGRFLTLDNYAIDIDNISPSSFNLYLFSQNDPVNYIDVNGNDPAPWWHWHTVVDAVLILGGIVLTYYAGTIGAFIGGAIGALLGGPLGLAAGAAIGATIGTYAAAMLAGAVIGAGISGLLYDLTAGDDNNDADWGTQLGLGAAFGAAGGALGTGITKGAQVASKAFMPASREAFKHGARHLAAAGAREFALGAVLGAGQQIATNAIYGQAWHEGVVSSALYGGIFAVALPFGSAYAKGRISASSRRATSLLDTYSYPMRSVRTGSPNLRVQLAQGRTSTQSGGALVTDGGLGLSLPYIDA